MLRIFLFLATNIAVMFMAAIAMAVLTALGIIPPDAPYVSMLVWCALFGFGGSILSLAMSKKIAKASTRARVIETPSNEVEQWLVTTVERQAKQAGIGMPEVAIFDSPDPNAFATGMFRNSALVAVSTGLLRLMSKSEAEAVLGHEVSHVANGDMITLTLIQGVREYVRSVPGPRHFEPVRTRPLHDLHGASDGVWHLRQHDRRLVLAPA